MTFSYFDNSTFLKRIFRFVSSTCATINVRFTVKPTFIWDNFISWFTRGGDLFFNQGVYLWKMKWSGLQRWNLQWWGSWYSQKFLVGNKSWFTATEAALFHNLWNELYFIFRRQNLISRKVRTFSMYKKITDLCRK